MASNYELLDQALFGTLAKRLQQMRDHGLTLEEMTGRFAADGIDVSRETVRRWCRRAGVQTSSRPDRKARAS